MIIKIKYRARQRVPAVTILMKTLKWVNIDAA
jgi:hypothetical protein